MPQNVGMTVGASTPDLSKWGMEVSIHNSVIGNFGFINIGLKHIFAAICVSRKTTMFFYYFIIFLLQNAESFLKFLLLLTEIPVMVFYNFSISLLNRYKHKKLSLPTTLLQRPCCCSGLPANG